MKFFLLVIVIILFISSCSSDKRETTNFNISSETQLCNAGLEKLKQKRFEEASDNFTELEIQYPYSEWSARGQMLTGFAHYSAKEYDEAVLSLSKFIELNPDHPLVPYAIFLTAYSSYERTPNINLDQQYSIKSLEQFLELTNRYPKSKYTKK